MEFRRRLLPHFLFFAVVWPLAAVLAGTRILAEQPLTDMVGFTRTAAGLAAGALYLLPELVVLAVIATALSVVLFGLTGKREVKTHVFEPLAFMLAVAAGFGFELPALLRHPMFAPLRPLPVLVAIAILVVVAAAIARRALPVAILSVLAWGVTQTAHLVPPPGAPSSSIYLIGLDSLSQADPLPSLRNYVSTARGTWYEHAVTPGLLTNSVWPAIIQHRRVQETGVFFTFQRPDWRRSPYHLIREARRRGFETRSFFSDQFTTYVGTLGGFEVDRSGPKGWLQLATATVKEAHLLAPVILPRLPRIPFSRTPRNQSGTFGFSLATELREIFAADGRNEKVFVAGHIDYLHQPAYPSMSEVSRTEKWRVRKARVGSVRDLSLHWQYPDLPGEPLGIYDWKIRHLQRLVIRAMNESGVADPARRNQVILFSDHGNRKDVGNADFARRRYYKVLFATIGAPGGDPRRPISLLDIPLLLGWPDPSRPGPAPLTVEYTNVDDADLPAVQMRRDGEVHLDPRFTALMGRRLLSYAPHSGSRLYVPVPSVPTEVTLQRLPD